MKYFKKMPLAFVAICFFCALIGGCASFGANPKNVYQPLNYTEADAVNTEVQRIENIRSENSVEALWRAVILDRSIKERVFDEETEEIRKNVSQVLEKCFESSVETYNTLVEEKKYAKAISVRQSLETCGYKESLSMSIDELSSLARPESIFPKKAQNADSSISKVISGTVTVWVDRGIAVQNGMGYADRVIGSGFFISTDGYLITNHHVIEDLVDKKSQKYSKLFIKLASDNETRIPAKVIGYDSVLDLALLKVEIDVPYVFSAGSSSDLDVGDKVYAIGSPVGLERTLTDGIISAKERKLSSVGNILQISAAVNPGNSGGPLIDEKGRVQAVVFAGMLQYEGLNFAIPVEYLNAELPLLLAGGERQHSWIGAFGKPKKDMGKNIGVELLYVMPGGSASRAGLKTGDIITAINGIDAKTNDDLFNIYVSLLPGTVVNVTTTDIDGNSLDYPVYLTERPKSPGYEVYSRDVVANSFYPIFGMKLQTLSGSKKYTISELINGGIADESGFTDHDPVEIAQILFNEDNSAISATLYTKKKKNGYIDVAIGLTTSLDSQYYF